MTGMKSAVYATKVGLLAFMAAALLGAAGLFGCSQGGEEAADQTSEPAVESSAPVASSPATPMPDVSEDAEYTVEAGDGAADAGFILQNDAEMQPVFGIAVRPAAGEYIECPFTVGDRLVPGMRCLVHYVTDGDVYDVRVTYADGSEGEIAGIALASLEGPLCVNIAEGGSVVFS